MVAVTRERSSDGALTPSPEEVQRAFAVLGLDPAAGPDLVDLAYWHLVDEARATLHGTPAWRLRLSELNAARACLSDHFSLWRHPARPPADTDPDGGPRVRRVHLVAVLPLLAALPVAVAVASSDGLASPERMAAAGAALLLAVAAGLLIPRPGRSRSERTATGGAGNPYRLLHLHPHAPPSLAALVYEHLRRAAAQREDIETLAKLEHAYARLHRAAPPAEDSRPGHPFAADGVEVEGEDVAERRPRRSASHRLRWLRLPWLRRAKPAPPTVVEPAPGPSAAPTGSVPRPDLDLPAGAQPLSRQGVGGGAVVSAPPSVGTLRVLCGAEEVLSVPLVDGGVYTIGTAAHCRVALPESAGVAAEHARITVRGGRVRFHHLAETGASLVNGGPATWAVLEPDDEIRIGPYVCRYLAANGAPAGPESTSWPLSSESAPSVHATTLPSPPAGST